MTLRRTLAALLAATALAAPAASAQPADMHASTAQAAAAERNRQDLRSPDAVDAARDRTPVNAPGATATDSQSTRTPVAPGQPTWAVDPKPIPPAPAPATASSDDGVDWGTIGLGIAGSLLVLGGIAAMTHRSRRVARPRVSA